MDERARMASDYADAAENKHSCNPYLTGCCFSETAIEVAFMKGWDEANARAEKRIQELEQELINEKDTGEVFQTLVDSELFDLKQKHQSMEKKVQGLIKALEDIVSGEAITDINCDWHILFNDLHSRAKKALEDFKKDQENETAE